MLLLVTGSTDGTSDRITHSLGEDVFRLNYDLYRDYKIDFTPDGWSITNPVGRLISSETVTKAMWWKAFAYHLPDDKLILAEIKYIYRELYGWCQRRGMTKGNWVGYHDTMGKMNILSIAKEYFEVPTTLSGFGLGQKAIFQSDVVVAKSLSSEMSSEKTVLMTTETSLSRLDPNYPWYLQDKIESDWDITVFQCGDRFFPFRRSRKNLKGIDWRAEQDFYYTKKEWFPFKLKDTDYESQKKLSADLNVDFGRFDFMSKGDTDDIVFLEFNAGGQWVFLDIENEHGLVDAVVDWIKK